MDYLDPEKDYLMERVQQIASRFTKPQLDSLHRLAKEVIPNCKFVFFSRTDVPLQEGASLRIDVTAFSYPKTHPRPVPFTEEDRKLLNQLSDMELTSLLTMLSLLTEEDIQLLLDGTPIEKDGFNKGVILAALRLLARGFGFPI